MQEVEQVVDRLEVLETVVEEPQTQVEEVERTQVVGSLQTVVEVTAEEVMLAVEEEQLVDVVEQTPELQPRTQIKLLLFGSQE